MDEETVLNALQMEADPDSSGQGGSSWVYVTTTDGVDIFHKSYEKHIGVMGKGFLPDVDPQSLFNFLKKSGNRVSFDSFCSDTNEVDKSSPTSDIVRLCFKLWPGAPRDVLMQRFWKSFQDTTFILASTSTEHKDMPPSPQYLRCDVAVAGVILSHQKILKEKPPKSPAKTQEEEDGDPTEEGGFTPIPDPTHQPPVEEKEEWIEGTEFTYIVVVDTMAWVPETVMRRWSLDYPLLIKNASEEMKKRGR
ncbi:hypothetical protein BLNAU_15473 [Blattamonas nauphoetae]|uniref:START domain-containing protein n=1 Tax=Blattamonas nauphoetae TaxID=2049346 RepID=A0ABQ9XAR2_9EUKA|nr:hypothetical protein BLNAU_15473 [Blattamonas nauphoetae]